MENFIKHQSLVEHIAQDIERKILGGTLKPGERIVEAALCETLGVSRSPVREAFRILESRGFVMRKPRKGISVAQITLEEAEDIYVIRANLESLAFYLTVKKQGPDLLKRLKELQRRMVGLAAKGDVKAYYRVNHKFHKTLINACGNQRLIQLINNFEKQTVRYRLEGISVPGWMDSSIKIHEAIIQSFESGDAEKVERLRKESILSHIRRFSQRLEEKRK